MQRVNYPDVLSYALCSGGAREHKMIPLTRISGHGFYTAPFRDCFVRKIHRQSLPVVCTDEKDSLLNHRARVSRRITNVRVPGKGRQKTDSGQRRRRKENRIVVRRSDASWAASWESSQAISLADLDLPHLAQSKFPGEGRERTDIVEVNLSVQKLGLGFYVHATIHASILQHCNRCALPFAQQVDTNFETCLAPTTNNNLMDLSGNKVEDDCTVISFEPGDAEIDLTSLVGDVVRLSQTEEMLCSQSCEDRGVQRWECEPSPSTPSINAAWLPLVQAKQSMENEGMS